MIMSYFGQSVKPSNPLEEATESLRKKLCDEFRALKANGGELESSDLKFFYDAVGGARYSYELLMAFPRQPSMREVIAAQKMVQEMQFDRDNAMERATVFKQIAWEIVPPDNSTPPADNQDADNPTPPVDNPIADNSPPADNQDADNPTPPADSTPPADATTDIATPPAVNVVAENFPTPPDNSTPPADNPITDNSAPADNQDADRVFAAVGSADVPSQKIPADVPNKESADVEIEEKPGDVSSKESADVGIEEKPGDVQNEESADVTNEENPVDVPNEESAGVTNEENPTDVTNEESADVPTGEEMKKSVDSREQSKQVNSTLTPDQAATRLQEFVDIPKILTRKWCCEPKTIQAVAICLLNPDYGRGELARKFLDVVAEKKFPSYSKNSFVCDFSRDVNREKKRLENQAKERAKREKEGTSLTPTQFKETVQSYWDDKTLSDKARADKIRIAILNACKWRRDKITGEKIKVLSTVENAELIFDNDPAICDLFGYDEFSQKTVFLRRPQWRNAARYDEWTDRDDAHLRIFLRKTYGEFGADDKSLVSDFFTVQAQKNFFHSVKEYIEGLRWDGVSRAETLFSKFLGVEDNEYSRDVTMHWLLGAMTRLYKPGCEFQSALVLHGQQGIGKSYVLSMLGSEWGIKLSDDVDDSHALDALRSGWIVEMEEFSAARKADVNALKSFISRPCDTRRAAYAKREENFQRHCVFAISVNDQQFLRDETGNRRFLILQCNNPKNHFVEGLTREYIQQVWAEVKVRFDELFKDGIDESKLRVSRATVIQAENIAEGHLHDDGLKTTIQGYLQQTIPRQAVWLLMTKRERYEFIRDHGIFLCEEVLNARLNALQGRPDVSKKRRHELAEELAEAFIEADKDSSGDTPQDEANNQSSTMGRGHRFYGKELRQHISPIEIFDECLPANDKRKFLPRILEVLNKIEGWTKGARLRNADPLYIDQKIVYVRDQQSDQQTLNLDTDDSESDAIFDGNIIPDNKVPW